MKKQSIAYANGRYMRQDEAVVPMFDRGYHFADGVYEVVNVVNGVWLDGDAHFARLNRSLDVIGIPHRFTRGTMEVIINELLRFNRLKDAMVYFQITRGVAPRNHVYNEDIIEPVFSAAVSPIKTPKRAVFEKGVSVITVEDERWSRCDAKTISLLPNSIAKQKAAQKGCWEAFQINQDGFITESSASNAFMVTKDDVIRTYPNANAILPGITRDVLFDLAKKDGIKIDETPFTLAELKEAKEAFLSSTTVGAMPVVKVDDWNIADGKVGSVTKRLIELYDGHVKATCGASFIK